MRTIAQALIARTTGKALPDQSSLARDASFFSVTRRDIAAQRYLASTAARRGLRRDTRYMLAFLLLAAICLLCVGLALIVSNSSHAARAGVAACMLALACLVAFICLGLPNTPND